MECLLIGLPMIRALFSGNGAECDSKARYARSVRVHLVVFRDWGVHSQRTASERSVSAQQMHSLRLINSRGRLLSVSRSGIRRLKPPPSSHNPSPTVTTHSAQRTRKPLQGRRARTSGTRAGQTSLGGRRGISRSEPLDFDLSKANSTSTPPPPPPGSQRSASIPRRKTPTGAQQTAA